MSKSKNYTDILLEDMNSKFDVMLEILIPMRQELTEVKQIVSEIPEIKADIKTIKHALKATNEDVKDHEHRITRLESKMA